MKFNEYTYQRPDVEVLKNDYQAALKQFAEATSAAQQLQCIDIINNLRQNYSSMQTLCSIRHTIDTNDTFYEAENTFFDEVGPQIEELNNLYSKSLCQTPFRKELEAELGLQLFALHELGQKTFAPEILTDLEEENKLTSEYVKIKGKASFDFMGETHNLSTITALEEHPDANIRESAAKAKWAFFAENRTKIEELYDSLVKVRHRIATKLGYKNFIQLAYDRLTRTDYKAEDVALYRQQIKEVVVPISSALLRRQAKRIGVEAPLKHFHIPFKFKTGNPVPKQTYDQIIANTTKMYKELSPETDQFFQFMLNNNLLDLVSKPGKAPGGYCTYIPDYQAPFIYSNFNGTSGDIDVLTHEAGHAFQVFSSRHFKLPEYQWPTMEACEIHSMSMEFFAYPWTELFFEDQNAKYQFAHVADALLFLPYGAAIDEFQHEVYANPDYTPTQRNAAWKRIQEAYLPEWNHSELPILQEGCFWQRQGHIFEVPFYYIDYTLAQVCALQFWMRMQQDKSNAWADYLKLCQAGGSLSFTKLVELANLRSPFQKNCLNEVMTYVNNWLLKIDDSAF